MTGQCAKGQTLRLSVSAGYEMVGPRWQDNHEDIK